MNINKVGIEHSSMVINTKSQEFDMQKIANRRFMYNPDTGTLVLGNEDVGSNAISGSHEIDLSKSGTKEPFDNFIRGWVGAGPNYQDGVIHFAPCIDKDSSPERFNKAFDAVQMFRANNGKPDTVIRGFGEVWERPLSSILDAKSVLNRLEDAKAAIAKNSPSTKARPNREMDFIKGG